MAKILIVTGDAGESYEALYAVHRFREAGWEPVVAAPSRRRLHLVMHDFEPGWDTYIERPGYGLEADLSFGEVRVEEYEAVLILGGRAPEYLRNDAVLLDDRPRLRPRRQVDLRDLSRHPGAGRRRAGRGQARHLLRARALRSRAGRRDLRRPSKRCGTAGS